MGKRTRSAELQRAGAATPRAGRKGPTVNGVAKTTRVGDRGRRLNHDKNSNRTEVTHASDNRALKHRRQGRTGPNRTIQPPEAVQHENT